MNPGATRFTVKTVNLEQKSGAPGTRYEFRVSGRLSELAQRAFDDYDGIRIVLPPPETLIYVAVFDEVHLQGILRLLSRLGLHLVSVNRLPGPRS